MSSKCCTGGQLAHMARSTTPGTMHPPWREGERNGSPGPRLYMCDGCSLSLVRKLNTADDLALDRVHGL